MTATQKRLFSQVPMWPTEDDIIYFVEHDWGIEPSAYWLQDVANTESIIYYCQTFFDNDIPVVAQIDASFSYPPEFDMNTTEEDFDYAWGDCLDLILAEPKITGISFEAGYDHSVVWLKSATGSLPLHQKLVWTPYEPHYPLTNPLEYTLQERLSWVDSVCYELEATAGLYGPDNAIIYADFLNTYLPDMPFGFVTYWSWAEIQYGWWTEELYTGEWVDVPTQKRRFAYYASYLKANITQPFDLIGSMTDLSSGNARGYREYMMFLDGMDILGWDAVKPAYIADDMKQTGVSPYYTIASEDYSPLPPDTFVNTGNEIVMLKESTSTPTVHEITVSGVDTEDAPQHIDYTLTLSPDHATFLDNYPLEMFGSAPTITYDNTNINVAILKRPTQYQ